MKCVTAVLAGVMAIPLASAQNPPESVTTWAFDTDIDPFSTSPIDLGYLNEDTAGETGFVRLSPDGNGFVRGDGKPIRFWGVVPFVGRTEEEYSRHARFLARMGVNMVRIGGAGRGIHPRGEGTSLHEVNREAVDEIWRMVAAMKAEGIYTRISPLWATDGSLGEIPHSWKIDGYSGTRKGMFGLLFFHPEWQAAYRAWMKHLLTEPNPYTGIAIKDDPAVAIIQIHSEDSILFFTIDALSGEPRREFERQFARFALQKYGGLKQTADAWSFPNAADNLQEGRLGLLSMYELSHTSEQSLTRARDQVEFYAKTARTFYEDMRRYLKDELGVKQLVSGSNFWTANPARFGDLERWINTPMDVIEVNDFFTSNHQGPNAAWRVEAGHTYDAVSAAMVPGELPANRKQVYGRPFIVSSTAWAPPQEYAMEGPVFLAAYGAMNGLDGALWIGATAPAYQRDPYMSWATVQDSHPLVKWTISNPATVSQFPAAALIFRQGLISPAPVVLRDVLSVSAMMEGPEPKAIENIDHDAYLVGRVEADYTGTLPPVAEDLGRYVSGEVVSSAHGQLKLDKGRKLLTIHAPAAQGAIGPLAEASPIELGDLTITSTNPFASIVAVALDEKPLRASRRILVQIGTQVCPTEWHTESVPAEAPRLDAKRYRITNTGRMPWQVSATHATLTLTNTALNAATRLDEHGRPAGAVPLQQTKAFTRVQLPENTMYLLLEAR